MKLIVGLGNPGARYERSRHNIGQRVVEELASRSGIRLAPLEGRLYRAGIGKLGEQPVAVAAPLTYMNESGRAVGQLMEDIGGVPSDLIVVHDDLDLALGRIQVKGQGGHGGHRGIESILSVLHDHQFWRLRIGVGRPPEGMDPADYVLSPFAHGEQSLVNRVVQRSLEALTCLVVEGPSTAMSRFNRKVE